MADLPEIRQVDDPAATIATVIALRRLADRLEREAVDRAIAPGWTWAQIAQALGVTRQAAHKRHSRRSHGRATAGEHVNPLDAMRTIKKLLTDAEVEARAMGEAEPGAEHLLLAALELPDGTARRAFERLDVDPTRLRSAIVDQQAEALVGAGDRR